MVPTKNPTLLPPMRVGLIADFLEEGWPSMDLVAAQLLTQLPLVNSEATGGRELQVELLRPSWWPRRVDGGVGHQPPGPAARVWNRSVRFPLFLRAHWEQFDLFHLVDHSYAHLVHALPAGRTVVTCHDLDTFRCLLHPEEPPRRGPAFRAMTARILSGLQRAAHVICVSQATRDAVCAQRLLPAERVSVALNGVQPELLDPAARNAGETALNAALANADPRTPSGARFDLLHVGSNVARKRLDVLLAVFARVRESRPEARLLRVGDPFTPDQTALATRLGVTDAITAIPRLPAVALGAAYRRADLLLQPSDAEGFGLPVIEALACGTPVLASDLPVLCEVGGEAATYAPVGDVAHWAQRIGELLDERMHQPATWSLRQQRCQARGALFSWAQTARLTAEVYRQVAVAAAEVQM